MIIASPVKKFIAEERDAFKFCLSCWVDWMRVDDRDLGPSKMCFTVVSSEDEEEEDDPDSRESDIYNDQRREDLKLGEAVGAMIDSLTICQRWAIHKSQGIASNWRYNNIDYYSTLSDAMEELEKKLRKHVATRIHFV